MIAALATPQGGLGQGRAAQGLTGDRRGAEWIVGADVKDYSGAIDQGKLMTLVAQRVG